MVLISRDKLSFVISWSISNDDLGWILIRHYDSWLSQSASETVWMVGLQRFLQHTSMKVIPNLKLFRWERICLTWFLSTKINWLWSTIIKSHAYSLSISLQNWLAWCNLSIFEHGSRLTNLFCMNLLLFFNSMLLFLCSFHLKSDLFSHLLFDSCHHCICLN